MKRISVDQIQAAPYLNGPRLGADLGNVLVLAPHPDDESLGCGGLITLLRDAEATVTVIFITSGSASHTSNEYPAEVLSKMRESEAIKACAELGVPIAHVHFLRAPDSGLSQLDELALSQLSERITDLFNEEDFSSVALPWRRDPHPDHRVVNVIGEMTLQKIKKEITKIEYPIWLWKNGAITDWPVAGEITPYRLDISKVFDTKWRAIQRHESQLGKIIDDDPNGFVLTDDLLDPFKTSTEYFFITRRELKSLDGNYFESLYSNQKDPWNFQNSGYEHEKYRKSISSLGDTHFASALELGCSIGIQTKMLVERCDHLTAIDISEIAVEEAKKNCAEIPEITFLVGDIIRNFPKGKFNLITCCEIGYYLSLEDLDTLFQNIIKGLEDNGKLLLVHWTLFVPDYPLSGDSVHDRFASFALTNGHLRQLTIEQHESYRSEVWQKISDERDM